AGSVAAFDHFRQRLFLVENVYPPIGADEGTIDAMYDGAIARLDRAVSDLSRPLQYTPALPPDDELEALPELRRNFRMEAWSAAVDAAKEHILDGDIFQVVLAQRFDLVERVDPLAVYRVLRLVNPSPYMYYLHHPEATVVGSSPEALVQLRNGRVISRPIAGTRRRGRNDEHDKRLEGDVGEQPKKRHQPELLRQLAREECAR